MKVLGIDPGYGRCGMAVVERQSGKDVLLYSDCVETDSGEEFTARLQAVVGACAKLIETHSPSALSIEKLFFNANQKTAMRVAEVRGAIILCAAERGVDVYEYTPAQIKSATSGFGGADKKQIASMIHLLVKIDREIRLDDEYDAIAIALAHLAMSRTGAMV